MQYCGLAKNYIEQGEVIMFFKKLLFPCADTSLEYTSNELRLQRTNFHFPASSLDPYTTVPVCGYLGLDYSTSVDVGGNP